ncbi:MAG: hypothetical protein J0H56_08860 [Micrococcales bacterium]|nr:hypothetical protein [Micrococcales bacterium]
MHNPKPLMAILWSAVWLVLLGTIALWLFAEMLSKIWGWLLLAIGLIAGVSLLITWLRARADRW